MRNEEEISRHPSFGCIRFSRINGNSGYLFKSDIQSNHYIELEVSEAENIRNLTDERIFDGGKTLLKIRMSNAQFSELITSLNIGCGVPCTIEKIDGREIPQIDISEIESRKTFVNRKFKERMERFAGTLKEDKVKAKKLIRKKNLSKVDGEELERILDRMTTEIESNIPFFGRCFAENMERVVLDVKLEIDSVMQHIITSSGLKSLGLTSDIKQIGED